MRRFYFLLFVLIFVFNTEGLVLSQPVLTQVSIESEVIDVGFFYSGQKVTVSLETPIDYDIVMMISGHDEKIELKKKGKVWGILWMNVGELT